MFGIKFFGFFWDTQLAHVFFKILNALSKTVMLRSGIRIFQPSPNLFSLNLTCLFDKIQNCYHTNQSILCNLRVL
jgi:hypothetical protein